jgi:mannose/cellobiose epimerase-like protein (N-acyl-D-glucosamine 2-epimerase family)
MYDYSVGYEHLHGGSERIAHHLYDTFDHIFPEKRGALMVEPPSRWHDESVISGYNNAYAVIGFSRYAIAFERRDAAERALSIYLDLDRHFTDEPLAERGSWYFWNLDEDSFHKKADNAQIHRCEAAFHLYRALIKTAPDLAGCYREKLLNDCLDLIRLFERSIARPEEGYTIEDLEDDGSIPLHVEWVNQSLAHGFEWLGFLFEIEDLFETKVPFLGSKGALLGRNTLNNGLAPNGCFRNEWVPSRKAAPQYASFWPQVEAILGSLWCRQRWGDGMFPMEEAERMMEFYMNCMFKDDVLGGGILMQVSENGAPHSLQTGSSCKCDHHAVRMCEKVLDYGLLTSGSAG